MSASAGCRHAPREAGLTQADVAERFGEYQSFVARVESGQRRLDVVELFEFAEALRFDPLRRSGGCGL